MKVFPVIHFLNIELALDQASLAKEAGADGVFLINHHGDDLVLDEVATRIKARLPGFKVGINLLASSPMTAAMMARRLGLDMVWADNMGVSSSGLTAEGRDLSRFAADHPEIGLFASVAFKYQAPELDPPAAAREARAAGFIPTTSGDRTGQEPDIFKVASMSAECDGDLAVASGMTPENIGAYAPLLSSVLVATGVSIDEHHFDFEKLFRFVAASQGEKAVA